MKADPLARAWARALFEVARAEDAVEKVDDDIATSVSAVRGHLRLKDALADPALPASRKAAIVAEVLDGEGVSPAVMGVVLSLVFAGKEEILSRVRDAYESVSEEARNVAIADVTTAVQLDDRTRAKLRERLATVAGKDVVLRERVDASILGGVVVRLGGRVMDGSVRGKLTKMREQLVSTRGEV